MTNAVKVDWNGNGDRHFNHQDRRCIIMTNIDLRRDFDFLGKTHTEA